MDAIITFFQSIGNAITGLIDFLVSLIQDLVWLVQTLAWAMMQVPRLVAWLPTQIHALIITLFGVVMLYKLIGREG